jgi:hypothetical protein
VAALVVALLAAAGCSLGDRAEQADRISASLGAVGARPVAGTISLTAQPVGAPTTPETSPAALAAAQAQSQAQAAVVVGLALDLAHRQATITRVADPAAPAPPSQDALAVFDDTAAYVIRPKTSSASSSERGWSRLDFRDLDEKGDASLQGVANNLGPPTVGLINPVHALELLRGVLSGSVERQTPTEIDGVTVEHYKVRLSRDDAAHELRLDEQESDARRQALRLLGVKSDVLDAEVWLTSDGRLRRAELVFPVRPSRRLKVDLSLSFDLPADAGIPAAIAIPKADDVLAVDSPAELVRALRSRST